MLFSDVVNSSHEFGHEPDLSDGFSWAFKLLYLMLRSFFQSYIWHGKEVDVDVTSAVQLSAEANSCI